jgi:hypothetical protein
MKERSQCLRPEQCRRDRQHLNLIFAAGSTPALLLGAPLGSPQAAAAPLR